MEHFEEIKRLYELDKELVALTGKLSSALTDQAEINSQKAIIDGMVKNLTQQKSTIEESIRIEKLAVNNLPK